MTGMRATRTSTNCASLVNKFAALPTSMVMALVLTACTTAPPLVPAPPQPPTEAKPTGGVTPAPPAPASATGRTGVPGTAQAPPAPPAPAPVPPPPGPLAAEQRWLARLFEGTPVQVTGQANGHAVLVEVPLRFAFDADSSQPKPPLQAVLQRLGLSLKRHPTARLVVTAPAPAAAERQHAMRAELAALGLPLHRLSAAASSAAAVPDNTIRLHLALPPSAIQRLKDHELPAPQPVLAPAVIKP